MTKANEIDVLSFEDALVELENIVERLERGDAPLEESIDLYARGAELKKHCENKLKAAKLKVDKIVMGSDGSLASDALDGDE